MTPTQRQLLDLVIPTFLHLPYRWGGANPSEGLDCSGLVVEILQMTGIMPARGLGSDATAQVLMRKFPPVPPAEAEYGDLVFFGATASTITHVGWCVHPGLMLEAGGGNADTVTRERAIQANARVRIRPFLGPFARKDLVGANRPEYRF